MKHPYKVLILPFCLMCAQNVYAQSVCESACAEYSEVFEGIEYCHKKSNTQQVFILTVDLKAEGIRPFVTPNLNGKTLTTSQFLSQYKVQAAVNTAFFNNKPVNGQPATFKPYGPQISDGVTYGLSATCSTTQTCSIPSQDEKFACSTAQGCNTIGFDKNNNYLQTWAYDDDKENIYKQMYNASSGGLILVKDGQKVEYSDQTLAPRTILGIDKTGRYFTMVVVDGRNTGRNGMNYSDLSDCLLALGVYQGINMDGGGSSSMVIQGKGVVNKPSDGSERYDPVHLGFFANPLNNNYSEDYIVQNTDIDGDGIADMCGRGKFGTFCVLSKSGDFTKLQQIDDKLTNDAGWTDEPNFATIRFADFNGDGLSDMCARSDSGVNCWPSNGSGFETNGTSTIDMADKDGYNQISYYSTIQFADINGDGRDDMCARFKDGFRCYPSLETGWGDPILIDEMSDENGWRKTSWYSTIRMGDINDDGKVDVCAKKDDGYYCWLSEGDKFRDPFKAIDWSEKAAWHYITIRIADINGDHKMDICGRDAEGISCYASSDDTMSDEIRGPKLPDADGWNDIANNSTLRFGDLNGDGLDDMCIRADNGMRCYLSDGTGFSDAIAIDDMTDAKGWNQANQYRTIRMGDINGDKKMEICGRNADRFICYTYTENGFEKIDGAAINNSSGWDKLYYYSTIRLGGPIAKPCAHQTEICDEIDNNCNGQIDEDDVCVPKCVPAEEICDGIDNDCDDEIDEDGVCDKEPECVSSEEICDGEDNDCDDEIDEDGVCGKEPECEGDECQPPDPEKDPEEDPIADSSADDDCGCSIRRTPKAPIGGAIAGLLLIGGLILRRRRSNL